MKSTLRVEGMTCVNCARTIELTLRKMGGVKDVNVSFELGRVYVEYDENLIDLDSIRQVIEGLGYKVVEYEVKNKDKEILVLCSILSFAIMGLMFYHSPWSHLLQMVFAGIVQVVGGYKFYRSAWGSLKAGVGNMDLLVSLGSTSAYLYSVLATFGLLSGSPFFETSAFLITFVRLGKFIEDKVKERAVKDLKLLFGLQTSKVRVLEKGQEVFVDLWSVFKGDLVVVKSGEMVPVDLVVKEGSAEVDESLITGESVPVIKREGQTVLSGSLVVTGRIVGEVQKPANQSYVFMLIRLVEETLKKKPRVHLLADRVSHYFVQFVVSLALVVFVLWLWKTGNLQKAVEFSLAVLVVSCPCAFGIAVPLATTVGLLRCYKRGLLVKNPEVFERIPKVDMVLFDKTGTLTQQTPRVVSLQTFSEDALELAYSIANNSNHPYSKAIAEYCESLGLKPKSFEGCKEMAGVGVLCGEYFLGRSEDGRVVLKEGDRVLAVFDFETSIDPKAKEAVDFLKAKGLRVLMLTGDSCDRAQKIAQEVGIEEYHCRLLPEEKLSLLEGYQKQGFRCAYVGDGINDAPVMSRADVAIAVGSAADFTKRVCDVVLLGGVGSLSYLFELSQATYRRIKQNLFWAFVYNTLAIPIGAGLLSSYGLYLKPEFAGLLMAVSSLSVVLNSVRSL
ncbi:heavy metal translocating P-type ATPase [Thermocrinis minervae]|uniref:Cu2+-exporting ATPase/Cu+-exporting ATPase n=1 Tax=Thermocrinis minervae TaxID=381751 RepID=A0A1M6Q847_9AQUI|nr:cation-translocating P-type ATPase [Thermocrinis minervae]SHK16464.1 Cu2+-exporting ATPase/Cu+-exporting ATPase [Thermocrinis minervae]